MYVIIDWVTVGFVHNEDGTILTFIDEASTVEYAEAELQVGL
jgi:hypothetical protein